MRIVFMMGTTCAGKTTIIDELERRGWGTVKVGKLLRAKYGEAFFKGQGAPAHTQAEAQKMMDSAIKLHQAYGKENIVVDGQPRTADHVPIILDKYFRPAEFVLVTADDDVRLKRARKSRSGDSLELAEQRLRGDYPNLCKVLIRLMQEWGDEIDIIDTSEGYDAAHYASLIC